jgi:hypothetical protein
VDAHGLAHGGTLPAQADFHRRFHPRQRAAIGERCPDVPAAPALRGGVLHEPLLIRDAADQVLAQAPHGAPYGDVIKAPVHQPGNGGTGQRLLDLGRDTTKIGFGTADEALMAGCRDSRG